MASHEPGDEPVNEQAWNGSRLIRVLSIVIAIGVLAGVAGLLVPKAFSHPGDSQDRKQVVARTTDFAVAYNTYGVSKVEDYQKRVKGLLSPAYDKEFVQVTNSIFKALTSKKQVSKGAKVLEVAVDSIDKDSAVALVAVDASVSNTDNKAAIARHLRWKVDLVKQHGKWNIDNFQSVAALQASAAAPNATPSAEPSTGRSPR